MGSQFENFVVALFDLKSELKNMPFGFFIFFLAVILLIFCCLSSRFYVL
jgi:hypothetical protein